MFFYISNYMVGKVKKLLGLDRISGSAGLSGRIFPFAGYRHIRPDPAGTGYPASGIRQEIPDPAQP